MIPEKQQTQPPEQHTQELETSGPKLDEVLIKKGQNVPDNIKEQFSPTSEIEDGTPVVVKSTSLGSWHYGELYNYRNNFEKQNRSITSCQNAFDVLIRQRLRINSPIKEDYYLIEHGTTGLKFVKKKTEVSNILLYRDPTSRQTITDAVRASLAPGGS